MFGSAIKYFSLNTVVSHCIFLKTFKFIKLLEADYFYLFDLKDSKTTKPQMAEQYRIYPNYKELYVFLAILTRYRYNCLLFSLTFSLRLTTS